jgi:hypothetical protein
MAQGELGVANLHCQRFAPAGAAAQHLHRLAGNKAQLAQASHQSRLFSPLGAVQCLYNSVGASGQVGQRAQGLVGICHCAVFA